MLNGLEARSPFLDLDIANFAMRLPPKLKYRSGKTKYLLKKSLGGLVSNEVLSRRKKGFGIPIVKWLREMDIDDSFENASKFGLSPSAMRLAWSEFKAGAADHRGLFWSWVVLDGYGKC